MGAEGERRSPRKQHEDNNIKKEVRGRAPKNGRAEGEWERTSAGGGGNAEATTNRRDHAESKANRKFEPTFNGFSLGWQKSISIPGTCLTKSDF